MTDGFYGSGSGSGSGPEQVPPQAPARVPAASAPTASTARVPAPRISARAYARIYEEQQPRLVAYARSLARNAWAAEDLVAEAHFRVWRRLSAGHEIDNVPAYLMTTVRRLAWAAARSARETPQDPRTPADLSYGAQGIHQAEAGAADPADQISSVDLLVRVLGDLPERWVRALWLAEAEGHPLETVGHHIGAKQGATAVLLHRAREGMRQAFLRTQTAAPDDPACQVHWSRMPAYVRDNATPRQSERLLAHVDTCDPCRTRLSLLMRANDRLPALVGPALLVFALGGTGKYLLSATAAGATAGTAAGGATSTAKLPAALTLGAAAAAAAIVTVIALGAGDPAPAAPAARTPVAETPVAETPVAEAPVAEAPVARTTEEDTGRPEVTAAVPEPQAPVQAQANDGTGPAPEPGTRSEGTQSRTPPPTEQPKAAQNPTTDNTPDAAQPQNDTTTPPETTAPAPAAPEPPTKQEPQPEPPDTEAPAPENPEPEQDDEPDTSTPVEPTPVEPAPVEESPTPQEPPSPNPEGDCEDADGHGHGRGHGRGHSAPKGLSGHEEHEERGERGSGS